MLGAAYLFNILLIILLQKVVKVTHKYNKYSLFESN